MAKQRTGKVKDKWKAKEWYRVMAPEMFDNALIAETMADAPEKLIGRIVETTMRELKGDISKTHLKLRFQVSDVKGSDAQTKFIGHSLASDYIRRLSRKRRSLIDESYPVITKDGFELTVKALALAEKKIQSSQGTAVRNIMKDTINESAGNKPLGGFINEMISGGLSANIFSKCKSIYPLKRVEIRASEIDFTPKTETAPTLDTVPTPETAPAPDVVSVTESSETLKQTSEETGVKKETEKTPELEKQTVEDSKEIESGKSKENEKEQK
ncbi:MAG: 30S ribosomal protein S3ae [Candidatus Thermoplasmatota archaeon]|nr:30S ribosomal protein S3ae [Candidatus Thermoplasmatota archaeon]